MVDLATSRQNLHAFLQKLLGEGEIPRFGEALTHPSHSNESGLPDNQRLEFLGDSVLGLCVSEWLIRKHPDADEGKLTRMRAALVNAEALAAWGRAAGVSSCIGLGKGARAGSEGEQTNVLADAVEALVAAVYDARGLDAARTFVSEIVRHYGEGGDALAVLDPKSALQEHVQAEGRPTPSYRVVTVRGSAHEQVFVVEVIVGDEVIGGGEGRSKRAAERAAAVEAMAAIRAGVGAGSPTRE